MTIDEVTDISPESHQEIPAIITLVDSSSSGSVGKDVYTQNCIACHGTDLKGGTAFGQVVPTLEGTSERKTSSEIDAVIRQGSASMPPFRHLTLSHMYHLLEYLEALSEELWRDKPPAGGYATPDVYAVNGKQYLVIACGSGRVTPEGDYYIAVTKMIERGFQGPAIS